jgi:GT2 family glycosyltransferase
VSGGVGGLSAAPPTVRLIVLNYQGGHLVIDAVESILRLDWPAERLDVVVVDNASTDGSDVEVERRFPSVRVVRSPANVGFTANNLAMDDLDGVDYVGLVNNDATVEPGWLRALVDELEADASVGAACPRILFAPTFAGATITVPTFRPRGDRRDLGVRLSGIRCDGRDAWGGVRFGLGFYGEEPGPLVEPRFRWTNGYAAVHVPRACRELSESTVETLSLRLAGPEPGPTPVTIVSGDTKVEADIGPEPVWIDIDLDGVPYDVVNNVGSVLTVDGHGADRGYLEPDAGQYDEPCDVFAWCGAGVLLSRRYIDDVGVFDPRYFLYYEDTDLSWRGQARGWRYRYVPEAVERHVHAATSIEGSDLFEFYVARNRLVLLAKWAPSSLALRATGLYLRGTVGAVRHEVVKPLLRGARPCSARARLRVRSFVAFLRLLPGILRERRSSARRRHPPIPVAVESSGP